MGREATLGDFCRPLCYLQQLIQYIVTLHCRLPIDCFFLNDALFPGKFKLVGPQPESQLLRSLSRRIY